MRSLVVALGILFAAPTHAADLSKFPHVKDGSFVEASGAKVLRLSIDVPAPPAEVWKAWTTAEGWKSFAVRNAVVDFRIGGVIETNYAESFTPGAPGNIENVVVAYVPERMLTIQNRKAPAGFANPAEFQQTVTVIELEPVAGGTRVTLSGVGFRPEPAFDDLYGMFAVGNAWTLEKLYERFANRRSD